MRVRCAAVWRSALVARVQQKSEGGACAGSARALAARRCHVIRQALRQIRYTTPIIRTTMFRRRFVLRQYHDTRHAAATRYYQICHVAANMPPCHQELLISTYGVSPAPLYAYVIYAIRCLSVTRHAVTRAGRYSAAKHTPGLMRSAIRFATLARHMLWRFVARRYAFMLMF